MRRIDIPTATLNCFLDGNGPPVLFLHGFPLDHTMWIEQLSTFAWSHRVIAPDLRGFGQSTVTEGTVTMEQFADDCVALLDNLHVNEPITLVGLSMGGYIAFQFARKYASRLGKLVLCDTRAAADAEAARQTRLQMAKHVLEHGTDAVADLMPTKIFHAQTFERQPQVIESIRKTIRATAPQGIAAAQLGMAARPDVTAWLPQINVPTLVIVGEADAISPPDEMRTIAAAIPHAQFEIIPNAGHMAPLEQPAAVNQRLRAFLAQ